MAYTKVRKSPHSPPRAERIEPDERPLDLGPAPERYPPPSYASTVWATPEGLRISLPATPGETGHSILLPFAQASWGILIELLRERGRFAERNTRARIGTRAAPVQYDIEGILRSLGRTSAKVPSHKTSLSDLGLED